VQVEISGLLHGEPVELSTTIDVPTAPDERGDRGLPVEWARARVRAFEGELDTLSLEPGAREARAEEIRRLGKTYRLATRFTSYVLTDSLAPDRIKPGDPEIRVNAPATALGVRGLLPWGETVECEWQADEGVWLGRFLVPRGVADGLYRVRVFVDTQRGTFYRGALYFRVDSRAPRFELARVNEGPVEAGDVIRVRARPVEDVFDETKGGALGEVVRDRIDLKRIVVQIGDQEIPLKRAGEADVWEADVIVDLPSGPNEIRLVTVDYALNSFEAVLELEVL